MVQGFVYHASYLRFFERARSEILDSIGDPMRDIAEGSHRFVVYEMKIRHRQPARLGDRLEIKTQVQSGRRGTASPSGRRSRRPESRRRS